MSFVVLSLTCDLASAQKTKATITSEINNNWPDNTTGAITPALLRSVVTDIVNSYIDMNGAGVFSCGLGGGWIASLQTTSQTCTNPASGTTSYSISAIGATSMMLGSTLTLTPQTSGNVYISAVGYASQNTLQAQCQYSLRYALATTPLTVPVGGATALGTIVGATQFNTFAYATQQQQIALVGYATGLTLATQYWFDIAQLASGGTCALHNVDVVVLER
jgi:hypothetical protein